MTPVTITYFDVRARAEPIRLILEEMQVPYVDRQITDEWEELRPKTPFGWLPSYREGNLEIWHSHAIYRHLARVHNIYGSTEEERVRCDIVEEALADLNTLIGRSLWRPNFASQRDQFIASELSPVLERLETFLSTNPKGIAFWVGSSLTFVDLIAFAHLDCTGSLFPEAMQGRDILRTFCDGIADRPRINAYLNSERRPIGIQYGPEGRVDARSHKGWTND